METAKLFTNGRSQAVRLPKAYRFEGKEVYIKKTTQGVLLLPKDRSVWKNEACPSARSICSSPRRPSATGSSW